MWFRFGAGFQGPRFGYRGRVFAIPIALVVMVAYIALVWFGGRIPGRFLLVPFVPVWLMWLPEWVWQVRHGFSGWERLPGWGTLPAWMRLTRILAYLLSLAIAGGFVVRYYLR